jgi:hypothetical protein
MTGLLCVPVACSVCFSLFMRSVSSKDLAIALLEKNHFVIMKRDTFLSKHLWDRLYSVDAVFSLEESHGRFDDAFRKVHPFRHLSGLRIASFRGMPIDDFMVADLSWQSDLKDLVLKDSQITDDAMLSVASFSKLECLDVSGTGVSDSGVRSLSGLNCISLLDISGTRVSNNGLRSINKLKSLRILIAAYCSIDGDALTCLSSLDKLEYLDISGTTISGKGFSVAGLPKSLVTLNLSESVIDDSCVDELARLTHLKMLSIANTSLSERAIDRLIAALPDTTFAAYYNSENSPPRNAPSPSH